MPPPSDTRRVIGPEESFPFVPESDLAAVRAASVLGENSSRHDGRALDAVRPMFLQCGTVAQASGSAYLELGSTKLLCSVHGPRDTVRRRDFQLTGQVNAEVKFTPSASRRRRGHQSDGEENDMSRALTKAMEAAVILERFPKAKVDIHVMVVEDGGGVLAAAMTAASLALADASIDMIDMVAAVSVGFDAHVCIVDPRKEEEEAIAADNTQWSAMTLAIMPTSGEVVALEQTGQTHTDRCIDAVKAASEACMRVHQVQRNTLSCAVRKTSN
ncbi:exosome complex component MTR3-like [Sycon ciliatum]|uniref:exosome complex component MTR3-like n=1 Tax=Sycon ciliatum TaxID=27933 RepID=UPI0031F6CF03